MQLEWLFHLSHLMHIMNFDKNFDARTSQDNAVYAIKALMMWHCESKQSVQLNMLIMGYTNSKIRAKSCPKAKNDSLNDDNKILQLDRGKTMEAIFTTISADSQNVLDTWIK